MKIRFLLFVPFFCCLLSACASLYDKDNTPPPSPLIDFKPEISLQSNWYTGTGGGAGSEDLKLVPAVTPQAIFTASKDGTVTATDRLTGKILWMKSFDTEINAGPGLADHLLLVGTRDGHLIAITQDAGKLAWKTTTSSEVLAPPVGYAGIALAKAIDGRLYAYSIQDGQALWHHQESEPSLILRSASTPKIAEGKIVVGFANGNLAKLSLREGNLLWQQTIATPESSFIVQRMVDIDADPIVSGNRIYVATYQGQIAALDLNSGRKIWTHPISSYSGIAADTEQVYVSDANGRVYAFANYNGNQHWLQDKLKARILSGPAVMGDYLVVGDAEGYLHWLSKHDGHFVARTKVNSSGVGVTPVVYDNILYVLTKDGHLAAYQIKL